MASNFWQNLFCYKCNKSTKHRCSIKKNIKLGREKIQDSIPNPYENPKSEWECWSCKSKKIKSVRKQENAYLALKVTENNPKTDLEKTRYIMDKLAELISYLEDRIEALEDFFPLEKRKRGIKIIK